MKSLIHAVAVATLLASTAQADPAPAAAVSAPAPKRVAALLPFVEDALRPYPSRVVVAAAVRRDLRTPPAPPALDLGNPHSPSFEKLAEAHPDLVVGDRTIHALAEDELAVEGGSQVLLIDTHSIDATFAALVDIGQRVGAGHELSAATQAAEQRLDALALDGKPKVLALFGTPGSFFAISRRNWLGDLLERLHFENVVGGAADSPRFPGLVPLSDEAMASMQPDLVLLVSHGDPNAIRAALEKRMAEGGVWGRIRTSATGGVHVLDPRLFAANPGLAIPDAASELVSLVAVGAPSPKP